MDGKIAVYICEDDAWQQEHLAQRIEALLPEEVGPVYRCGSSEDCLLYTSHQPQPAGAGIGRGRFAGAAVAE